MTTVLHEEVITREAFPEFVERYERLLRHFLVRVLGMACPEDVEDALALTWERVWRVRASFRCAPGDERRLKAWLIKVALSVARETRRQREAYRHRVSISLESVAHFDDGSVAEENVLLVDPDSLLDKDAQLDAREMVRLVFEHLRPDERWLLWETCAIGCRHGELFRLISQVRPCISEDAAYGALRYTKVRFRRVYEALEASLVEGTNKEHLRRGGD